MQITEHTFGCETTLADQKYILDLVRDSKSLDLIFDQWFFARGNRLGLGTALNDDCTLRSDAIALSFDAANGDEVGAVFIDRSEFIACHQQVPVFDSFVKGGDKKLHRLQLQEGKFDAWKRELGFIESYALMSLIGPRVAALPLMLSFGLSMGGMIQAEHIDSKRYDDEDYKFDLDEEGININDYFLLTAAYCSDPTPDIAPRWIFDPIYCRKTP